MAGGNPPDDDDFPEDDEAPEEPLSDSDFHAVFNEELSTALDIDSWANGLDLETIMERFRKEVACAVNKEERLRSVIREEILPLLAGRPGRPPEAGVYKATAEELSAVHEGLLFPGRVEAVNGISTSHESLPLGITQLAIAVVGYGGTSGTFSHRLFRKEMAAQTENPVEEARHYLNTRQNRAGSGQRDNLTRLARRGIKAYAERAFLLKKSQADWRVGRGNPCPHELLTGSGNPRLQESSFGVLRELIHGHQKFVFIPGDLEERGFLTLGYALDAGEYAILQTLEPYGSNIIKGWSRSDPRRGPAQAFVRDTCSEILTGVYRASDRSPPRLFHAHRAHVHMAVRVAMADSLLRPERGFPMLLDVAEASCRSAFGEEGFLGLVQDAYAHAGAHLQFFSDRKTRR